MSGAQEKQERENGGGRQKEELKESWKLRRASLIQIAVEQIIAKLKTNSAWCFNISLVEAITNDWRFSRDNVKFPFRI